MRAPAELDDSNRGHFSPPEPLLSDFVIQSTIYFALLATIAAQQALQRSPGCRSPCRRAVH